MKQKKQRTLCLLFASLFLANLANAADDLFNYSVNKSNSSNTNIQHQTNQSLDKQVWLSIGSDGWQKINTDSRSLFKLTQPSNQLYQPKVTDEANVFSIAESQVPKLSQYMHDEFNRCGGFVFHDSLQEAIDYTQRSQLMNSVAGQNQLASLAVNYTIDNPNSVNLLLNSLSSSDLNTTVSTLANYNNRYYTQQTGIDSANWIKSNWQSISQSRNDISVETFAHSWGQPSVIATIQGSLLPNEVVIIGGHLDSINGSNPSSGRAPGADDNASGIAVVTEALRAIVTSGYKPARTIKFIGYAAEEVGLRGSKAIAEQYKNNSVNVVGVVQFDMTGYHGTAGKDIVFMNDYTSSAQNTFMMQLIDTYLNDIAYGTSSCGYGCSDHASWHNLGYPASMPFESTMSDINGSIHTSNDTSFDDNHAFNFARLAVVYLAELAKSDSWSIPPDQSQLTNGVAVTNLTATQGNSLNYTMEVPVGVSNIKFVTSGGSGDADLYVKFGSEPTDSNYDCRPYKSGNNETCNMTNTGGTYYVRVKAYSTFSGLSLTGSFQEIVDETPPPIDQTISNISVTRSAWSYHSVDLSAGYSNLSVTISGGTGDADLYVRQGAQPTTSSYNCRPYKSGNNENCTQASPASTIWHIGIRGYQASSGVTLNITATP